MNHLGGSFAEREERVLASIEAAGLRPAREYAFRYPHELSGGQRQRVVIAGGIVMGPELVVADEPVSMLDVSIRTELLRLMLDLREERGLTYVFITHDLSLAWVIADRIAVMYLGKIMEIGPADKVINRPHNPYTKALVSVAPDARRRRRTGTRAARTILVGETPDAAHVPTGCRFHPRCPLAFDRCREAEPPLFDVGDGQSAACWLVEGGRSLPVMPAVVAAGIGAARGTRGPRRRNASGRRRLLAEQPAIADRGDRGTQQRPDDPHDRVVEEPRRDRRSEPARRVHRRPGHRAADEDVRGEGQADREPADARPARIHRCAEHGQEQDDRHDRLEGDAGQPG